MSFESALKFVLQWEGGYVNHKADPGGETNFGVTHATYIHYGKSKGKSPQSVKLISQFEVHGIYQASYWVKAGCETLPPSLALCHFDWAVNSGCNRAIQTLQQTLGVSADGIIGPMTIRAIATNKAKHKESWLCDRYCAIREGYYRRWGVGKQAVFLKGWLNRLAAVRAHV